MPHAQSIRVRGILRLGLWRLDLLRDLGLRRQSDMVGLVRGGDWDLADYPLADLEIFEAIRQRFEGGSWEEIQYFKEMRCAVNVGIPNSSIEQGRTSPVNGDASRIFTIKSAVRASAPSRHSEAAGPGTRSLWR